jgi:hypothetical protein
MNVHCDDGRVGRSWYRETEIEYWRKTSTTSCNTRSKSAGCDRGRSKSRQARHVKWAVPLQEQIKPPNKPPPSSRKAEKAPPPRVLRYRYIGDPCYESYEDRHYRCDDLRVQPPLPPPPPQYMLLQQIYYFKQTAKKPDRPVRQTFKFSTRTPTSCTGPKDWTTKSKRTISYDT